MQVVEKLKETIDPEVFPIRRKVGKANLIMRLQKSDIFLFQQSGRGF